MARTPRPSRDGWIPWEKRNRKQRQATDRIVGAMPKFFLAKQTKGTQGACVKLWDAVKFVRGGKFLPCLAQATGSCVGNGAWNAVMTLMSWEIARRGEAEQYQRVFLPYHYGRGRYHAGISGTGEGSTGSGQAEALVKDGVIIQQEGLPEPSGGEAGLCWGSSVEMQWSNGKKIADKWVTLGQKHPVKTASLVTSYDQVRDAISNGYPVTVASNRGFKMTPKVDKGKSWGVPSGTWWHQMFFDAVDDDSARPGSHIGNSWGADAHGTPADDSPPGGFWVDADVVDYMVRQEDSFAFSQFDGFPEQEMDWMLI